MDEGVIEEVKEGIILNVKVNPGVSNFELKGINSWRGNLRISVSSEAEKGKANEELLEELEETLSHKVEIVAGVKSREKKLLVRGATKTEVIDILDL